MKVIRPIVLTNDQLVSSSVAEIDYPVWSNSITYAVGERVMSVATHRHYASAIPSNGGHDPAVDDGTHWTDIGPTNRWAMFDQAVGTSTTKTGSIYVVLEPGSINAVAVVDTDAVMVAVTMSVGGTVIYSESKSTNVSGGVIADWSAYFFDEVGQAMATTFLDLPLYVSGSVAVTITGADPDGDVSVGTLIVGRAIDLGSTEVGPSIGILDFSRKETDDFGATTVVERAWAKRMTARSLIATSAVDGVQRQIAALRAKPALWIAEEGYDSLTVYGFFKDFSVDLELQNISYCSLTIEGLI